MGDMWEHYGPVIIGLAVSACLFFLGGVGIAILFGYM